MKKHCGIFLIILFISINSINAEKIVLPDNIISDINKIYQKNGFEFKGRINKKNISLRDLQLKQKKHKCASILIKDLKIYSAKQNLETKKLLKKYLKFGRPSDSGDTDYIGFNVQFKEYQTDHFLVHYVDTPGNTHSVKLDDTNTNNIPDVIENYSKIFESCWISEIALNFHEPVNDENNNPNWKYDVYFVNLQEGNNGGAYAYTNTDPEENHPTQSPTFIVMDNDYTDNEYDNYGYPNASDNLTPAEALTLVRVTFAHEFFHAIQNAYSAYGAWADSWYSEACATWIEDVVYNEINDYYFYLNFFYKFPTYSLEFSGSDDNLDWGYEYGECVFPRYLYKKFGINFIKETLEYMEEKRIYDPYYTQRSAFDGIINSLENRSLTFNSAYGDFRAALYFSGQNYSDIFAQKYYSDEESHDFPVSVKTYSLTNPFTNFISPESIRPAGLGGTCYMTISPSSSNPNLSFNFEGTKKDIEWGGSIIKFKNDNSIDIEKPYFKTKNSAYIYVENFTNTMYSKIVLFFYVINGSKNENYSFTLTNLPKDVENVSCNTLFDSDVKISWTNPQTADSYKVIILRNDSTEISDYYDTSFAQKNSIVFNGTDTTFIDKGLTFNHTYYYKFFTYTSPNVYSNTYSKGVGKSVYVLDTTPPPKIILNSNYDPINRQIDLDWSALPTIDIDKYAIYFDTINFTEITYQKPIILINSADEMKYHFKDLLNNVSHYFAVTPIDKAGNENFSITTVNVKPYWDNEIPSPIAKIYSTPIGSGKIKIDWSDYIQPNDLKYYKIYIETFEFNNINGLNIYDSTTPDKTSYIFSDLENNKPYYIAVTGVDYDKKEDKEVKSIKVIPFEYKDFSITINTTNVNVYIDGNYAYQGHLMEKKLAGKNKLSFNTSSKKHFLVIENNENKYMNSYSTIDLTGESASNLIISMSLLIDTQYKTANELVFVSEGLSSPFVVDWNNDGKKDLLVGNKSGTILYYQNIGSDNKPDLADPEYLKIDNTPIYVGEDSVPFVVDWNNDSKKDLLIGTKSGKIYLIENIGTDESPSFIDTTCIYISLYENITPFVVDWNKDTHKDIIFGTRNGDIYFLANTGTDEIPKFTQEAQKINEILIDAYSAPFLFNWDQKFEKDLIVGNEQGTIQIFNIEKNDPFKLLSNTSLEIKVSNDSKPFIVDWNNDGLPDILIGDKTGKVTIYYGEKVSPPPPPPPHKICIISKIFGENNKKFSKIKDKFLFNSYIGKIFVKIYYKLSPKYSTTKLNQQKPDSR